MASPHEQKQIIEDKVIPFFAKDLPDIMARLDALEAEKRTAAPKDAEPNVKATMTVDRNTGMAKTVVGKKKK